jgi:hypothetical protein
MNINPTDLFPNINSDFSNIGFLFGAGTSKCAGYPLMKDLTIEVLSKLPKSLKDALVIALEAESISYDFINGLPNIEIISDIALKYEVSSGKKIYSKLSLNIRKQIFDILKSVKKPNIENHVKFFEFLKKKYISRPGVITIITSNYDLLFEQASDYCNMDMENGFNGIYCRYFDSNRFYIQKGRITGNRFIENKSLVINLLKVHGSISWFYDKKIGDSISNTTKDRIMILPRKTKVIETLDYPYDQLFRVCADILGRTCKYLVTCGYSFGDDHINDLLLRPKIVNNSLRVTALEYCINSFISEMEAYPSMNYVLSNKKKINGIEEIVKNDVWQFEKLVGMLK